MSDLKIFTDNIEPEALDQIYTLVKQPAFADCKVRIMPDCHAGKARHRLYRRLGRQGDSQYCRRRHRSGMYTVRMGKVSIDFEKLMRSSTFIPHGHNIHPER